MAVSLLALVVLALSATPASAIVSAPYIVNGGNAPAGTYPFITVLLVQDPSNPSQYAAYCDGALIAPSWVLTAAHCVTGDAPPKPDAVIIGRQTPTSTDGDFNHVDNVIVNPAFDAPTVQNDVALLHLSRPSPQPVLPMVDDSEAALWAPGSSAMVIGFGDTDPSSTPTSAASSPSTLQQAPQTILPDQTCAQQLGPDFFSSSMLCAAQGNAGPCYGDSGGPLLVSDGRGGWIEVGVVSEGPDHCATAPSTYVRLAVEAPWIRQTMSGVPALAVSRVAGADRYATAALLSSRTFSPGVPRAFVVTGAAFPDALAVGPLAAADGGPVLLVDSAGVPPATADELTRLRPTEIDVVGGRGAVSDATVDQLRQYSPVVRIGADATDRFATAAAVASRFGTSGSTAFVADGLSFADALSGGPAAAAAGGPLYLVAPDSVPASTLGALQALRPQRLVLLGGVAAISSAVEQQLAALVPGGVTRFAGVDRYATAAAVSAAMFSPSQGSVFVATGQAFPDALAATPAAHAAGAPVLLTAPTALPSVTAAEIERLAPSQAVVLGGPVAVGDGVASVLALT